jgi:histidyl-tRNA synthetase
VRLSDRNLWFHFLGSLGLDDARIRAILGAVDKFERHGDEAFKGYEEAFGPIDPELKQGPRLPRDPVLRRSWRRRSAPRGRRASRAASRTGGSSWAGLAAMGLADFIQVDLGVVRGLAYYTGFVFEAFDRKGELRALAGGGRYDDLVGKLGGSALPAVGFAIGDMTFALLLEERGLARRSRRPRTSTA